MRAIHHFTKSREFRRFQRKLKSAQEQANSICHTLSTQYLPPYTEPVIRDCKLQAYNTCSTRPIITRDMLPYSFTPASKPELGLWEFLDSKQHYTIGTTYPVQPIVGEDLEELQYVIRKAVNKLNNEEGKEYTFQRVLSGHVKYSGSRGREYILDLILADKFSSVHRRVNLLRVAQPEILFLPDSLENKMEEKVSIILPLSHVTERFSEFLLDYEDLYLKTRENTRLVLSVFGKEDLEFVQTRVNSLREKYPEAEFEVVVGKQQFTRARALHLGLSILNNSELAFLCDVDMSIEPGFLNRCRMNTIQGKRIYYPVFFKYYNMNYVYRFRRKPVTYKIQREHGHWAEYSFGMVCVYKSDYVASEGFDTTIVGWGGEDVDLFNKFLKTKIEILKSPDPALSHRYHDKVCSRKLNPLQFSMCISSRNEALADRMQLAEYVFYLEDHYGLTHRSLWNK